MPCQLSYGAVRAVALLAGQTVAAALAAVKSSLPATYQSSFLGMKIQAAETLTDPDTGVGYAAQAGDLLFGNHLQQFTATTGVNVLAYFSHDDKNRPGGAALVR